MKYYSQLVNNTPGFAPYIGKDKSKYQGYAVPTGTFNNDYSKYNTNYTEYYHDGVDFGAAEGTEIKSFIYGTVRWMYLQGNGISGSKNGGTGYGYMLFIENSDMNKVYVLCHILPDMWKKGTVINQPVYPDMTVAKVGNIGNSSGPHLHITVIDCSWKDLCVPGKNTFNYSNFQKLNYKRIDPFNNGIYWKLPK